MNQITKVGLGIVGTIFAICVLVLSYQYFNGEFPDAKPKDVLLAIGGISFFAFISLTLSFGKWKLSR